MAAAAVTHMPEPYSCCIHDKRIELRVNGELRDIALIDAVVSSDFFAGARAIWDPSRIERIVVSRCHPATIGFSAIPGAYRIIGDAEPCGFAVTLEQGGEKVLASIAAGVLTEVLAARPNRFGHFLIKGGENAQIIEKSGRSNSRKAEDVCLGYPYRIFSL